MILHLLLFDNTLNKDDNYGNFEHFSNVKNVLQLFALRPLLMMEEKVYASQVIAYSYKSHRGDIIPLLILRVSWQQTNKYQLADIIEIIVTLCLDKKMQKCSHNR